MRLAPIGALVLLLVARVSAAPPPLCRSFCPPSVPAEDCCIDETGGAGGDVPCVTATTTATWTISSTPTRTQTFTPSITNTPTVTPTATAVVGTATATPTGLSALSWCPQMVACWEMEEATNASRLNDTTTSCGSTCDLTDTTTAIKDTTNKVVGTGAAQGDGSTATRILSCPFATCGASLNPATSASWGGFFRATSDSTASTMQFAGKATDSRLAWAAGRDLTNDQFTCRVIQQDTTDSTQGSANNAFPINTFISGICTFNDTANQLINYADAASTTGTVNTMKSVASGQMAFVGNTGSGDTPVVWPGQVDEGFFCSGGTTSTGVLTAMDVCRICSCGVNGSLCTCDPATPANYLAGGKGRNVTSCFSCTLPACNAVAPTAVCRPQTLTPTPTVTATPTVTSTPTATATSTATPVTFNCGTTTDPAFSSGPNFANIVIGSVACTCARAGGCQINSLSPFVSTAAGHIRCAAYTVSGHPIGTATEPNATSCLTASTVATSGRMTMAVAAPASCTVANGTAIYCLCNTDDNGLAYGLSAIGGVNTSTVNSTTFPITYPSLPSPLDVGDSEGTYACYANITGL